ncbi:MAG: VCBS repeat-containing protein [Ignavibacteriae bacterium]|nr:VCBS repeat-containing protein [Ignavibacteriota bacterium]MCB9244724.1 VCBS repeat-containing protein [Ignavibacteriales bacterium]
MRHLLLIISFLLPFLANSQTFTKITSGVEVTDGGDSRAVTWIDYDGDGYLDLYVTNGPSAGQNNFLYHNNGDGTFTKITGQPLVNDNGKSDGASWGDYNNDGNPDVCVVNWYGQNNLLYRNDGSGTFTFMNTSIVSTDGGFSETCSWGDYDNDSDLDLYVTNSDPPFNNYLYMNNGSGDFIKIDTGIAVSETFTSRGITWIDYDNDGDQDIFVCNENNQKNNLYENMGSGYFVKITAGDIVNDVASSWTGSWGDIDNDGDMDLFVGNWGQSDNLYINNGDKTFAKVTTGPVVQTADRSSTSSWIDYDNDGDLDLFVTTSYGASALKNLLYKNLLIENGSLSFEKIVDGDLVNDLGWTYGHSWGDYDKDGDLDMFGARVSGAGSQNNVLFRNDDTSSNKWVSIKCKGTTSNRSGIGAVIKVRSVINGNAVYQVRTVMGQDGYCSQNLEQHIGLGNSNSIDSVIIMWPSGTIDRYGNTEVNKFYEAVEGQSLSVGVSQLGTEIPQKYSLYQNYPNPFNPVTKINYDVARSGYVELKVFDIAGREIASLVNGNYSPGMYSVDFDATAFSSGVYFYTLRSESFTESRKMMLVK